MPHTLVARGDFLIQTFDITYEGMPVGTAQAEKQGLYYKFSCRCKMPDDGIYRIHILSNHQREDLGICVPMDDCFGMDKAVPAKRLEGDDLRFELIPKDWKPQELVPMPQEESDAVPETQTQPPEAEEQFVPVREEEPFEFLDQLEDAVLEIQSDEVGILLRE